MPTDPEKVREKHLKLVEEAFENAETIVNQKLYWKGKSLADIIQKVEASSESSEKNNNQFYMSITYPNCFEGRTVTVTDEFYRWMEDNLIMDCLPYFRINCREDNTCLLSTSYNTILGGRWLSFYILEDIAEFFSYKGHGKISGPKPIMMVDQGAWEEWFFEDREDSHSNINHFIKGGTVRQLLETAGYIQLSHITNLEQLKLTEDEMRDEEIEEPGARYQMVFQEYYPTLESES